MRSARLLPLAPLLVSLALGMGLGGCQYDPHPAEGALGCSRSGECPEGYSCQSNLCFTKNGLPSSTIGDYVGTWLLTVTAKVQTQCDNGFSKTDLLSPATNPSYLTVSQAGLAALTSVWSIFDPCDVTLRWDASGAHLGDPASSCVDDSGDPVYTWTTTSFDLLTPNGRTGTHHATYTRKDEYFDGTVATCNQTVTASLIKQP
jgi:hypothetical protein